MSKTIAKEYADVKEIKNWAQQVISILASCNLCSWDKKASTDLTIQEVLSKAKLQTYH